MTDSEYVPSEREVRADFVLARTRNFDSYMMGRPLASEQKHYGDEFDRFLARVRREAKAEAWDLGHSWGWSDAQDAHDVRQEMDRADWPLNTPNPYRQEPTDAEVEAKIQADTDALAAEIHEAVEFQYGQCDHGTYHGGHLHGEPYRMCRINAERIVRRRAVRRDEEKR